MMTLPARLLVFLEDLLCDVTGVLLLLKDMEEEMDMVEAVRKDRELLRVMASLKGRVFLMKMPLVSF